MNDVQLIRGEYFPSLATKVLFHYDQLYCDPHSIQDGDIVYCDTHRISEFIDVLNKRKDLTVITHNSDYYVCDNDPFDTKGVSVDWFTCYSKWYAQNAYSTSPHVVPLPIGFENVRWESVFGPKTTWLYQVSAEDIEPSSLIYLNCNKHTNLAERQKCYEFGEHSCLVNVDPPCLSYVDYLRKIKQHKFVLSPRGNGLDCHRTWEILMMKRVPILKREGRLEHLYRNLPVVFVDDWSQLTTLDLDEMYSNCVFENQEYLHMAYWSTETGE